MTTDNSGIPQTDKAYTKPRQFRLSVKIAALLIPMLLFVVLAEVALRFVSSVVLTETKSTYKSISAPLYTAEELRRDLPRFTKREGRDCIKLRGGRLYWDPRFGYAGKVLDKDCARKLFATREKRVVLMGGSAMEDFQAPNYLTTIDTYAFGNDSSIASLNLAESGARHSNMLFRFIYEVIELHPTYVVFLDGANEFNSVRFGGAPEDDFYWTAGVKDRVEHPFKFFFDKLVEQSRVLQVLAVRTGLIQSARLVRNHIDAHMVEQAADYYIKMRSYTETLCKAYSIKCIFIIQPLALLERHPSGSTKQISEEHLRWFKSDAEVYGKGYDYILHKAGDKVHDASHLFDGKDDVFVDFVHFNKRGSKLMGDYIRAALY
jgi:hypothetical protein